MRQNLQPFSFLSNKKKQIKSQEIGKMKRLRDSQVLFRLEISRNDLQ